jgi:hypothetical protein
MSKRRKELAAEYALNRQSAQGTLLYSQIKDKIEPKQDGDNYILELNGTRILNKTKEGVIRDYFTIKGYNIK